MRDDGDHRKPLIVFGRIGIIATMPSRVADRESFTSADFGNSSAASVLRSRCSGWNQRKDDAGESAQQNSVSMIDHASIADFFLGVKFIEVGHHFFAATAAAEGSPQLKRHSFSSFCGGTEKTVFFASTWRLASVPVVVPLMAGNM
jgi:hypothetical protein